MMKTILLINPPQPAPDKLTQTYSASAPSLGLAYVAAVLKKEGFSVYGLDFDQRETTIQTLTETLETVKPSIVGITSLTNTFITALTVGQMVKKHSASIKVVLGGQHPTFCYEQALQYDFIDYVIRGEGEYTFKDLCLALIANESVHSIPGVAYREGDSIKASMPENIVDIDSIPFPVREIFDLSRYYDPISIITSRGCKAKCIFCSATAFREAKVRLRSAENVLAEIEPLYRQGHHVMNFVDDNFMLKKQRVIDICKGIKKNFPELFWTCSARADFMNKELIKLLSVSGCKGVHFGVESSSEKTQKAIGKYLSLEKLETALSLAQKYQIRTFCSFILGLPEETPEQIKQNIDYALSIHEKYNTSLVFGILTPFPGTPIFNNPDQYGIEITNHNYSDYDIYTPVLRTKYLDENSLRSLLYDAQKSYLTNMSADETRDILMLSKILGTTETD
jgi:radical SAM superfamily enzyme YgiQ (UPF0313 family)